MTVSRSSFATRSGVIPAKAGIHMAGFAVVLAGTVRTSTPMASAEWIPAFAGMTAEGVVAATVLPPGAICDHAPRSAVIPAIAGMKTSLDLRFGAR